MSDPKDVVRRFFDTLGSGDFDALGEFFTDDSVWQVNDVGRGLPGQQGRRAIIDDFLKPVRLGLFAPGDPKIEVKSMIAEGNRVAAQTIGRGTLLNGQPYENHYVFIMEVEGETVKYLCEYMDSVYARAVTAGIREAAQADEHTTRTLKDLGH